MTESYDHFFVAMAVVEFLVMGLLYSIGRLAEEDIFWLGGFLVVFSVLSAWGMRREFRGVAEVGPGGLTVRAGRKTFVFRWNDIAEGRVTDWAGTSGLDGLWARLLRTDLHEPFIQLKLIRRLRMNDLFSRYSTDRDGLPLSKGYRIFLDNPTTLAELIASYMRDAMRLHAAASA